MVEATEALRMADEVYQNFLVWLRERQQSRPQPTRTAPNVQGQREIIGRLQSAIAQSRHYEDFELQDAARDAIPVDELHEQAQSEVKANADLHFHDQLVKALLRWFKTKYFTWVNAPECQFCKSSTTGVGGAQPTPTEASYQCGRVELYKCTACSKETRFPRYNDLRKLMETKSGRCGEWANVFCLFAKAMGFDARYVLDFTDHVWTEIYNDREKRWINCDCCEGDGSYDQPLMYEAGWGKKLTYIFSIGPYEVVDVIHRYTARPDETFARRTLVDEAWLSQQVKVLTHALREGLPPSMIAELEERDKAEETQLKGAPKVEHPEDLVGRQSGSVEWRATRGEIGKSGEGQKDDAAKEEHDDTV
ncbi:uncharacterized protein EV422DRAFT_566723 [Fimicolochytrium jonesii]|uniref:uncharacterized protein n=1 Tax=Fimicolochytrium jonesii TaxID=1396493 RepID=UPI0022FDC0E7|nr:uncharacterized protein EV422DRAFT_566723 [Fimicolochytrium jonesii]KAI8821638.1 hypothetical protein EV422DRAFT_566723 [Fimicolochytrium jonesii]